MAFQHGKVELRLKTDSLVTLEAFLRLALGTILSSTDEVAVRAIDRNDPRFLRYLPPMVNKKDDFPIILVGGWYLPKPHKKSRFESEEVDWRRFQNAEGVSTVEAAVAHVLALLKERERSWKIEFREKFGDEENQPDHSDATFRIGFELRSCDSFPEVLAISLVYLTYYK